MSEPAAKKRISRRTIIIIVVILLLLAGGGAVYYFFFSDKAKEKKILKQKAEDLKNKPASDQHADNSSSASGNDTFPLDKGSQGENVLYLQRALNKMVPVGYKKIPENSKFGDDTYKAVITWVGTKYYPVTQANWTAIMNKANNLSSGLKK